MSIKELDRSGDARYCGVMAINKDLLKQLEDLSPAALAEVEALVRVLQQEAETLRPEEAREVEAGRQEILEGQWARWRDIKRTDV